MKVCTGNKAVMEKQNNFFKECQNAAAWYGTTAGDAAATVVTTTTPPVADPVFGGVIYQKATGGVV